MPSGRPPLRSASRTTSPPFDGGEERREPARPDALPLPPEGEYANVKRSHRKPGTTARASNLSQRDNQAEALLWLELKRRKLGGCKFTRQLPIGPYFADFACRERWLVVEIDGSQHADSAYDHRRDEFMRSKGYSTLRFWNVDVLKHGTSVCETILAALRDRLAEDVNAFDLRFRYTGLRRSPESFSTHTDPTS